jgi:transposase-like protein
MTESKKRKVCLPAFKAKVSLDALAGMKTINQIAQEYGVHPVQVGLGKREIQSHAKSLRDDVTRQFGGCEPFAHHQTNGYSRVEMSHRYWTQRVGPSDHG